MRPFTSVVLLALALFLGAGQALAGPTEPTRSGVTPSAVLALISQTGGDDAFSTADLTSVMAPTSSSASRTQHYGPYASSSPDSSTCGNDWANDTFDRHFTVRDNRDGTFTVVEQFKRGAFTTTNQGPSPGGCDTNPGGTIVPGKVGDMHGYEIITVVGTQTSPSTTCQTLPGCTTDGFVTSHFAGIYTVSTYFFHYSAGDQSLAVHQWKNASCDRGGNDGDIASTSSMGLNKTIYCP